MIKQIGRYSFISISRLQSLFKTPSVQYLFTAQNAPHRAIVVSNRSGDYQLHAVDFASGFHRQITRRKGGALFGSISSDGQYIYILDDKKGAEHGHFLQIPFEGGKQIDMTPRLKPYFSYSMNASDDEKTLVFTAALENKNTIFVTKESNNGTRQTYNVHTSATSLSESICSSDGTYVCVAETDVKTKQNTILVIPTNGGERKICSCSFSSVTPLAFSRIADQRKILALARRGEWLRPMLYDFAHNRVSFIQHGSFRGDVWVLDWNENRKEMILCDVYQAQQKLYIYNLENKSLRRIGPKNGSFNFHFGSVVRLSDNSLIFKWSDFNNSPRLIRLYASQYNKWSEIPEWSGNIKSQYIVKSLWTRSSDGEDVQMWIMQPKGIKQPPFVIDVHGGPHGVVGDEFSPEMHAWIESGFGYCAVNYRGSIGFGKKFERKIYGNPGHWEVEDIVSARNWLIQNRYADPKRITLYGWSWGGYVTLLATGTYPALWSSSVAGAGIADCLTQYENEPAYFRAQDEERFRGTPETARSRYLRSSPITYVNHIQSPLLILHGENDIRCPPRQMKRFIDVLKKNKKSFDVEWFRSGHIGGFTNTNLRVRLIAKAIRFALGA
ncbi:MAG: S9 family peptidase [Candidatus Vogelbacteria bacterium]|nr:S9 family peptidase [Candidatus Vogelbacteria bacterium]